MGGGHPTHRHTFGPAGQDFLTKQRLAPEPTEPLLVKVSRMQGPDAHAVGLGFCLCCVLCGAREREMG
jgi:hypothetical protein